MYVRVYGVVGVWEDWRWGVLGFAKRFVVEASSTFSGSNIWVARFVLLSFRFLSFFCVILFSPLFDYHYFVNTFDYGFPTSSTYFFHSLNLGECYFANLLFLGLGECYWMEFSLNVYEIKFFLVIWCGFLLLLNISFVHLF